TGYGRRGTCIDLEPSIRKTPPGNRHIYGVFLVLYHFQGLIDSLLVIIAVGIDRGLSIMEGPSRSGIANIKNSPFRNIIVTIEFTALYQVSRHGIGFLYHQLLGNG